jgi:hypothetical protein
MKSIGISLLLIATSALAQLPEAPQKQNMHAYLESNTTKALVGADFAVRLGDAYSTHLFMTDKCKCLHEAEIGPIANTNASMYSYSITVATGVQALSYELWKHHHSRMARVLQVAEVAGDGGTDIWNFTLVATSHKPSGRTGMGIPTRLPLQPVSGHPSHGIHASH